jgi:hypothetical protein
MHGIQVLCKIVSSKYPIRICSVIYKLKLTARKTSGQMLELSAINLQVVLDKEKTLVAMLFSIWYFHIFRKRTFTDTIIQQDLSQTPPPLRTRKCSYMLFIQSSTPLRFERRSQSQWTQHYTQYHAQKQIPPQTIKSTQKEKNLFNTNNICSQTQEHDKKWSNFTYIGKETRRITRIFRNTNLKISYKTNNTIETVLKEKPTHFVK